MLEVSENSNHAFVNDLLDFQYNNNYSIFCAEVM